MLPLARRRSRVPPAVAILVALAATVTAVVPAHAGAQAPSPSRPPATAFSQSDPGFVAGDRRDRDRVQSRLSAAAKERRRQSRLRLRGASRKAALQAARESFREEFAGRLFDGAEPAPGLKVVKQQAPGTALVQDESGTKLLLSSSTALQARAPDGQMAPIDLSLLEGAQSYTTANSNADLRIYKRAADGVKFGGLGFSIAPQTTADTTTGADEDGRIYYQDVAEDTGFVVVPREAGSELGWLILSPAAPERFVLDVDLPDGGQLRRAMSKNPIPGDPPRAIEITDADGKAIGYVYPPLVYDSDGVAVTSDFEIDGSQIAVTVEHRGKDLNYPLFADPEVGIPNSNLFGFPGWRNSQIPSPASNGTDYYGVAVNDCAYNNCQGMYLSMPTNNTYAPRGTSVNYSYQAPPNTYVYRAVFGNMAHSPLVAFGYTFSRWFNGLIGPTNWEANVNYVNQAGGTGPNPFGPSSNAASGVTHDFCQLPRCNRAGGTEQNQASIGLAAQNDVNNARISTGNLKAVLTMTYANVFLGDRRKPTMTSPRPPDRTWINDAANLNHTLGTVSASDLGLGVNGITLTGAASGNTTLRPPPCSGDPIRGRCPSTFSTTGFNYRLNEGTTTLSLRPEDIVDNQGDSPHIWTEKIDRTPPAITPSGTLYDARGDTVGPDREDYTLSVNATDGNPLPVSAQRSGTTKVAATLDPGTPNERPMTNSPQTAVCARPEGSCELTLTTSLTSEDVDQLEPGQHTVSMTANDAAGNTTPAQSFSFTYDPEKPITIEREEPDPAKLRYSGPASCSSLPPAAATLLDTPAALAQSTEEAIESVREVLPAAVASSTTAATAELAPKLSLDGDNALSSGSLTDLRISKQLERGFSLGAGPGGVCFSPTRMSDEARTGVLASDGAMIFANSDQATSTVVRPTPTGAETLTVLNNQTAPRSFSWHVNAGEGRKLVTLSDGSIAVVNPLPAPEEDIEIALLNHGLDQLEPGAALPETVQELASAVGKTAQELEKSHDVFARAQNSALDEIVLVFPKPWAIDAAGEPVPVSMGTDGQTITMTVDPSSDARFPIIADPTASSSASSRGAPLRLMTFNTRSPSPEDPDVVDDDETKHNSHAGRVAEKIRVRLGQEAARGTDRPIPGAVGAQEMCQYDLGKIRENLNNSDGGSRWSTTFRGFGNSRGCPNVSGRDGVGGEYGLGIIRNTPVNNGNSRRYPPGIQAARDRDTGQARGYMWQELNVRDRPVEFYNTHLATDPGQVRQRDQSQHLLSIARDNTNATAAAGDFNTQPYDPDNPVAQDWGDSGFLDVDDCRRQPRNTPCRQPTRSGLKIDFIFTRDLHIDGASVQTNSDTVSDHDGLVASTYVP